MRHALSTVCLIAAVLAGAPCLAKSPLGEALKDIDVADHWIYDDWPRAVAEARASGKPLLVVVRCVPCPPGRTLDVALMQPDPALAAVEKQFVCVRLIQTNSLDLDLFQYDYDMSWAAMFLSPDLAVYGRYGSRNASGPASDALLSAAGFRAAAERALKLHANYPANQAELAGKIGPPSPYKRPTEIPGLTEKPARAAARQECIHCHMVKEYALRAKWEAGKLTKDDLFVFPQPTNIGLAMKLEDGAVVQSVAPGSAAAAAGLAAGDELVSLGGQPVISLADIQWVLHGAKPGRLPVVFRRGGETRTAQIQLPGDWKQSDIAWRASSWYGLRQGVKTEPLTAEERTARGLPADSLALVVKLLAGKGGPKVQAAGLQKDDLIIAVDGQSRAMSESEFLVHLRLNHGPQDAVKLTVLRGNQRKELTVPLW